MTISVSTGFPVRGPAGFFAAILATLILMTGPLYAQDKDPLVAKVNGVEVHQSDLAAAEDEAGQIPPMSPEAKQDYLVQFVADMILVSQAAQDKKFADSADFKRKLEFARKKLLMEGLLQSVGKEAITDEAMHKVYDEAVKQIGEEKEVHARHILFRAPAGDEKASKEAEDKIKAVIVRLKKGEDFAKVAGEVTEDPSGKANGGDLGYFSKDQMVPEFSDTAFKLENRADFGAGKNAIRLARHQGRRQTHETSAEIRRGKAANRKFRGPQGAGRTGNQTTRRRQNRTNGQAGKNRRQACRAASEKINVQHFP